VTGGHREATDARPDLAAPAADALASTRSVALARLIASTDGAGRREAWRTLLTA